MITPYNFGLRHIQGLRRDIIANNLVAPAGFFRATDLELQQCYNGIGPDRWAPRFRDLVSKLLRSFEADALIHDWEYTFQPKTYTHFTIANARFLINTFVAAYAGNQGRWSKIISQTAKGALLALLCQLFGWSGYKSATPLNLSQSI